MKVIKIKESLFQSLINDGCAHIILKAGPAEKYTLDEIESGTAFREIVITETVNEETMTKEVIIISNKLRLSSDTPAIETLEDDIVTWTAETILDRNANNLIK